MWYKSFKTKQCGASDELYTTPYGRYYFAESIPKKSPKKTAFKTILIGLFINLCIVAVPSEASPEQQTIYATSHEKA